MVCCWAARAWGRSSVSPSIRISEVFFPMKLWCALPLLCLHRCQRSGHVAQFGPNHIELASDRHGMGACTVTFNVSVQLSSPRWVVGRALSLYQTSVFSGMAVGSWIWGLIADSHGAPTAFLFSAALLCIGAATGLWLKLSAFDTLDLDPSGQFSEPELRLDLRDRSGPIKILVDYVIDPQDIDAFLEAMQAQADSPGSRRRAALGALA